MAEEDNGVIQKATKTVEEELAEARETLLGPSKTTFQSYDEYFPGYANLLKNLAVSEQNVQKDYTKKMEEANIYQAFETGGFFPQAGAFIGGVIMPGNYMRLLEYWSAGLEVPDRIKQEVIEATDLYNRASFMFTYAYALPLIVADRENNISSYEDAVSVISSYFNQKGVEVPKLNAAESSLAQSLFSRLEYLIPEQLPDMTAEEVITALTPSEFRPMKGVHELSIEELRKQFSSIFSIENTDTGMTAEQQRELMNSLSFTPEQQQYFDDIHEQSRQFLLDWADNAASIQKIKEGISDPDFHKLTLKEKMMLTVVQPIVTVSTSMENYFNLVPRHLAGKFFSWVGTWNISADDSYSATLHRQATDYMAAGLPDWQAYSQAFNDVGEHHKLWSFLLETIFDPTTYIGFGIVGKALGKGSKLGRLITGVEVGLTKFWDDVAFGPLKGAINAVAKTPGQAALARCQRLFTTAKSVLEKNLDNFTGKVGRLDALTGDEARTKLYYILDNYYKDPHTISSTSTAAGEVAAALLERDHFTRATVKNWLKELGVTTVNADDLSDLVLMSIQKNYELLLHVPKTRIAALDYAKLILMDMGLDRVTNKTVETMADILLRESKIALKSAKATLRGDTAKQVLDSMFERIRTITANNLRSPTWRAALNTGKVTAWTRYVDKFVRHNWVKAIDSSITSTMAKHYLLFANFGVMNWVENLFRSFLGGGEMFYPKMADPVFDLLRHTVGLENIPMEFIHVRHRLETAIASVTGEKLLPTGDGIIPYITKSGKYGKTITIGGREFKISSMSDWNDMFAEIGTMQRAWYVTGQYKHELKVLAPDQIKQIDDLVNELAETHLRNTGFSTYTAEELDDTLDLIKWNLAAGPENIADFKLPLPRAETQRAMAQVQKILDQFPDVPDQIKKSIVKGIDDGSIWNNVPGFMDERIDELRDFYVASILDEANKLRHLANDAIVAEITEPAQAGHLVNNIGEAVDAIAERIQDFRATVLRRAGTFGDNVAAQKYHSQTSDILDEYLNKVIEETDYMYKVVKARIEGETFDIDWTKIKMTGFTSDEVFRFRSLIDSMPYEMRTRVTSVDYLDMPPGVGGDYDTRTGAVRINKYYRNTISGSHTVDEESLVHEFMHGLMGDRMDGGDKQVLYDFMDAMGLDKNSASYKRIDEWINAGYDWKTIMQGEAFLYNNNMIRHEDAVSEMFAVNITNELLDNKPDLRYLPGIRDPEKARQATRHYINTHFPQKLPIVTMNDAQREVLTSQLDNLQKQFRALVSTRQEERRITEALIASKPKNADSSWWTEVFYKERNVPWEEYRALEQQLRIDRESRKLNMNFVFHGHQSATPMPQFTPRTGPLTIYDITDLFKSNGVELYNSIMNFGAKTIHSKDAFIDMVIVHAEALAKRMGKTASDLGFNATDIGRCYDQMLRSSGVNPKLAEPLIPGIQPLRNLANDIQQLKGIRHIDPEDYAKFESFISKVEQKAKELPMFSDKVVVPKDLEVLKATSKDVGSAAYRRFPQLEGKTSMGKFDSVDSALRKAADEGVPASDLTILERSTRKGKLYEAYYKGEKTFELYRTGAERGTSGAGTFYYIGKKPAAEVIAGKKFEYNIERTGTFRNVLERPDIDFERPSELLAREWFPKRNWDKLAEDMGYDLTTITDKLVAEEAAKRGYDAINYGNKILQDLTDLKPALKPKVGKYAPITYRKQWDATRQQALDIARDKYHKEFTDYDNRNWFDAAMRTIFPFWTYEWQRWFWLPRQFLSKPALTTNMARYMNYTDQGYISLPFFEDYQINPLRGTVFGGGFRRLYMRDYPEYYDAFGGYEVMDFISRLGFYPGAHIMGPTVLFGTLSNRRPEMGELLPAWVETGINALGSVLPKNSKAIEIIQMIYPDRFRDYQISLDLSSKGYDGTLIWDKIEEGTATDQERSLWNNSYKRVARAGALFEQTGVYRFRPEEFRKFRELSQQLTADLIGISVEEVERINSMSAVTGMRVQDYFPLDTYQQEVLYEFDCYNHFGGVTAPLYPSFWQEEDRRAREYYDEVEAIYDRAYYGGTEGKPNIVQLNQALVDGTISPEDWVNNYGSIMQEASAAVDALAVSQRYAEVPKTLEERIAQWEKRGQPQRTYHPSQELEWMMYDQQPKYIYNSETNSWEWDFTEYFANIDAIISAMSEPYRTKFLEALHYSWTPMQKLYWETSRQFLRPYRLSREVIFNSGAFTQNEIDIIRRFDTAKGAERDALMEVEHKGTGKKLISYFNSLLSEVHTNMRIKDPEMEAWLLFWGKVDTANTELANTMYQDLRQQYLVPSMVGVRR
jgi:hypothetical protein